MKKTLFLLFCVIQMISCAEWRKIDAQMHSAIFGDGKSEEKKRFNSYLAQDTSNVTKEQMIEDIHRGVGQYSDCVRSQLTNFNTDTLYVYSTCASNAIKDEEKYGKITPAYILGVIFSEWVGLAIDLQDERTFGNRAFAAWGEAQNACMIVRKLQNKFDLNDRKLSEVTKADWWLVKPFIEKWKMPTCMPN